MITKPTIKDIRDLETYYGVLKMSTHRYVSTALWTKLMSSTILSIAFNNWNSYERCIVSDADVIIAYLERKGQKANIADHHYGHLPAFDINACLRNALTLQNDVDMHPELKNYEYVVMMEHPIQAQRMQTKWLQARVRNLLFLARGPVPDKQAEK